MRPLIFGLLIIIFTCCGPRDKFDVVTKIIHAPDTMTINKDFGFQLTLRNDSDEPIKLTIDKDVLKSLQFLPDWRCDGQYVVHRVPNPESVDNDYETHYLNKSDSLTYDFTGLLSLDDSDSLKFTIAHYDRVFKLKRQDCNTFTLTLSGMWLPGDTGPLDPMENYNFGQQIEIRE